MFNPVTEIIDNYVMSKEHEEFAIKNNTEQSINKIHKELLEQFGEDKEELLSTDLFTVFNEAEYYGIMQGIKIGLRIASGTAI